MRRPFFRVTTFVLLCAAACTGFGAALPRVQAAYPLDGVSRAISAGEKLPCEEGKVELTRYRGERVRYERPLRVHPAFKLQLSAFEGIVAELGRAHFGRAPRTIAHFGAYACRPMRRHAHWASEHALGNALDVAGFDFGPLPKKAALPPSAPKALRRGFSVRVDRHWHATAKDAAKSAFLRELAEQLASRPDVFRSLVGPDYPNHHNHFHLAHPPYRMVKVGDIRRWWFW